MVTIKKPKPGTKSQRISHPTQISEKSTNTLKPLFSFHYMHPDYCITACESDGQLSFVNKLTLLSQLTWQQILFAPKHGLGSEKISNVKAPTPRSITEDVDFIAIRYDGKKPMVGFRENQIFHIVWFEKDFGDVYDH